MSRRLVLIAVPVATLGLLFAVLLGRAFLLPRPLPTPPAPRASEPSPRAAVTPVPGHNAGGDLGAYSMIPARSLFSPARSETSTVTSAKPAGRPVLHGVVLDGPRSRAYLEDSLVKGVFGYNVGDTVGQEQIMTIRADRVMLSGPGGTFEVLLNDPATPKRPALGVAPAPAQPSQPAGTATPAVRRPGIGAGPAAERGQPNKGARSQSDGARGQTSDDDD